jgi:tetratricopeptide (TPR) repeat protein
VGRAVAANGGEDREELHLGLRKALGEERLVTRSGGYELRVGEGEFDLERFECLLEGARQGRTGDDAIESALALWRGEPLAEFGDAPFVRPERLRLDDLQVWALETQLSARVERGESAHLVGEIERLVVRYPLHERLHAVLMLALYRADRQAEALEAYQRARRVLKEELGLEPGRRLQELERRILNQDEALAAYEPEGFSGPPAVQTSRDQLGTGKAPQPARLRRTDLPVPATPFLGRERELADVCGLLAEERVRLLTLTGPGGTGKTRLALQAASEMAHTYRDGVGVGPHRGRHARNHRSRRCGRRTSGQRCRAVLVDAQLFH